MSYHSYDRRRAISDLIGQTFTNVEKSGDGIRFTGDKSFEMCHDQDCCESVNIEEISGDLQDLVGSPILEAEERTSHELEGRSPNGDSETWTFYIIRTVKGTVNIRWYGTSNGYYSHYSESVDLYEV